MKLVVLALTILLLSSVGFAKDAKTPARKPSSIALNGSEAKSLFFSLAAIKASGGKLKTNSNSVQGGFRTSYWTKDGAIQCTQSKMETETSYDCSVEE